MQINVVILLFLCNQLLFTTASFARVKVPELAKQPNVLIILADDLGMVVIFLYFDFVSLC